MCEKTKVVDVTEAIKTSKSKFIRNLPTFAVKKIAKVVREKELNEIYEKYCDLQGIDFVKALLFEEFNVTINIKGEENVQKDKLYVYVANHPLGAIDALSFLYIIDKLHGRVISPSNELFEFIPNLSSLIVGINVFGHNTKAKAKALNAAFETDAQIMIFPAGEVSRKTANKIEDPQWQKTFVTKALQYNRDIVPVFISGNNSKKFYRTANWRKKLGLKFYLETLLLPQEMLKQYDMNIDFVIGKPISVDEMRKSNYNQNEWTQKIKQIVYSLSENI
jgi:putative hemolysin